ncbi:MAG: START domain-containing protein, partial [Pseudomonas sp.]
VEGLWKLVPMGGGEVEVTYQVHSEPGGSVPSWLANSFVVDAPYNTLAALRARAEKR